MITRNLLLKRFLSTQKTDIGQIFIQENVQRLLKDISRFDEEHIFAQRTVPELKSPKMLFMSDEQLKKAQQDAYVHAKARLQMPPVMAANTQAPAILSRDKDIVGYTKFKIMFIDISPGQSDRARLMSVREPDGTLRETTYEERTRLNHMFYPSEFRSIDTPKMFEEKHMLRLLKNQEYLFILNRACNQFEPDDPRYVETTTRVYTYIDEKNDHNKLLSTRHFGPMCLFLAYNKQADRILIGMLSGGLIADAAKLVKIFNTCHNIEFEDNEDHLAILKSYAEHHSAQRDKLELVLQGMQEVNNPS